MKASTLFLLLLWAGAVFAQTDPLPAPTTKPLPEAAITLRWNDAASVVSVALPNEGKHAIQVIGVRTTGSLFVMDFPATVASGKTGEIVLKYVAQVDSSGTEEFVHVLTSEGLRTGKVVLQREEAVQFEKQTLEWPVGGAAAAKSVVILAKAGTAAPKKVRVLGKEKDNSAVLETVEAGRYRVTVTPGSTAKPRKFAVAVEFDQPLPGVAPVIYCVVADAE